jgi:hypothetical protein
MRHQDSRINKQGIQVQPRVGMQPRLKYEVASLDLDWVHVIA